MNSKKTTIRVIKSSKNKLNSKINRLFKSMTNASLRCCSLWISFREKFQEGLKER